MPHIAFLANGTRAAHEISDPLILLVGDEVELIMGIYAVQTTVETKAEADRALAWLAFHVSSEWKLESLEAVRGAAGAEQAYKAQYLFADKADGLKFQTEFLRTAPSDQHASPENGKPDSSSRTGGSSLLSLRSSIAEPQSDSGMAQSKPIPSAPRKQENQTGNILLGDAFVIRATELMTTSERAMASSVRLIGMAKIRAHFGAAWEKVATRADRAAHRAIQNRLGPRDVCTRIKESDYLILFADLTLEEAQLKCTVIADEIARALLGDSLPPNLLQVKSAVAEVDRKFDFEDAPNMEELAARLLAPVVDKATAAPPRKGADEQATDELSSVKLLYRPMWNVRTGAISGYLLVPGRVLASGGIAFDVTANADALSSIQKFELDCRAIKRIVRDMNQLIAAGRKVLIATPVHFETLSSTTRRMAFLKIAAALPPAARQMVLFEIVGAPDGVPQGRLLEMATAFKSLSRAVLFEVQCKPGTFATFRSCGILAVGVNASTMQGSESDVIQSLNKFAEAAAKADVQCYVHGLRSLSMTTAAVAAGFNYVDGTPVASIADAPGSVYRFGLGDLFRQLKQRA